MESTRRVVSNVLARNIGCSSLTSRILFGVGYRPYPGGLVAEPVSFVRIVKGRYLVSVNPFRGIHDAPRREGHSAGLDL